MSFQPMDRRRGISSCPPPETRPCRCSTRSSSPRFQLRLIAFSFHFLLSVVFRSLCSLFPLPSSLFPVHRSPFPVTSAYARPRKPTMRRIVLRRYSARAPRFGLRLRLASRGTLAEPFGRRRIVGHESGLRRTRIFTNLSSRLCEGIRNKPHSCSFVSGEAPHSCPEASATSRRLKRCGEARRRSCGLSSLL